MTVTSRLFGDALQMEDRFPRPYQQEETSHGYKVGKANSSRRSMSFWDSKFFPVLFMHGSKRLFPMEEGEKRMSTELIQGVIEEIYVL